VTTNALRFAEEASLPLPLGDEEPAKPRVGRPPEGVKGFATRLTPETITDIKNLAEGLRLRSEGKAIERAVAFYKAHLLAKTRKELELGSDMDDEAVLLKAYKVDD
jgi:hypothetical protein